MPVDVTATDTSGSNSDQQQNPQGTNCSSNAGSVHQKSRNGVPQGGYLNPKTSGIEIGSSYIARSGFPLLATSKEFVTSLETEIDSLLNDFKSKWQSKVEECLRRGQGASEAQAVTRPSPFGIFRQIYKDRGWHYFQLYWSEHQKTRRNIYHALIRLLTDRLHPLISLLSPKIDGTITVNAEAARCASPSVLFGACGILFMLRLLQGTSALAPSDVNSVSLSGRIPIEADLYHALTLLPEMVEYTSSLPVWPEQDALQPIDEIICIIRELMGTSKEVQGTAKGTSMHIAANSGGVFDILMPTQYETRGTAMNNCQSSQAQTERKSGKWGMLRTSQGDIAIPLSRADAAYNHLRQRLALPLRVPPGQNGFVQASEGETGGLRLETCRGKRSAAMVWPDEGATTTMSDRMKEVDHLKAIYETSKREVIASEELSRLLPSMSDAAFIAQPMTSQDHSRGDVFQLDDMVASARRTVAQSLQRSYDESRHP